MDNFDQNNSVQQNEPKQKIRRGTRLLYKILYYNSYHTYRNRLYLVRSLLWLALILWIGKGLIADFKSQFLIDNTIIFLMGLYLIGSYTVMAKASSMFKDSDEVMKKIAFENVISKSWHIYDGIYQDNDPSVLSVEIVFFKEKAFLTNFLHLLGKHEPTLPLTKADILNLRDYVQILCANSTPEREFKVYTTLTDEMAKQLSDQGIELTQIDNKYRDKPFRWDYANATGRMRDAFTGYPSNSKWTAYLLTYTEDKKQNNSKNADNRYFNMNKF